MLVVVGLLVVALVVFLLAVFPPADAPHWWRHGTRPLRRRIRPGHYRDGPW